MEDATPDWNTELECVRELPSVGRWMVGISASPPPRDPDADEDELAAMAVGVGLGVVEVFVTPSSLDEYVNLGPV